MKPSPKEYRPDIAGLRAIAILAVVGYHAGLPGFNGGYVGVDVFFVISGFLITGKLHREIQSTGTFRIGAFLAGRVRRLVPALALVLTAVAALSLMFSSPIDWGRRSLEIFSATGYFSNLFFTATDATYSAQDEFTVSPVLHTWTLGVEEQYYLVVPLIFLLVIWMRAKRNRPISPALVSTLSAISIVSVVLSVWWSVALPNIAFYNLPTRLWEFALGGLLAMISNRIRLSRRLAAAAVLLGFAGIVYSTFGFYDGMVYPGTLAALPVVSTLFIIAAGLPNRSNEFNPATRFLSSKPAVSLGEASYSWYLWHWPFIVFIPQIFTNLSDRQAAVFAVAGSLIVAYVSLYFFERPLRYSKALLKSIGKTLLVGLLCTGFAASGAFALNQAARSWEASHSNLVEDRKNDEAKFEKERGVIKVGGDTESTTNVLLLGDSHMSQWYPALDKAGSKIGVRVTLASAGGCPSFDIQVRAVGRIVPGCVDFRQKVSAMVQSGDYDAVVLSVSEAYLNRIFADNGDRISPEQQAALWKERYGSYIKFLSGSVDRVGVIDDNPQFEVRPAECLSRVENYDECNISLDDALTLNQVLKTATQQARAEVTELIDAIFEPTLLLCPERVCVMHTTGGNPSMKGTNHFSETWIDAHEFAVEGFLRKLALD